MSLLNIYNNLIKLNKLFENDDLDTASKLQKLIETKDFENIELAYQLAKSQNVINIFEKILFKTFVPNELIKKFEFDVQPLKNILVTPLNQLLKGENIENIQKIISKFDDEGEKVIELRKEFQKNVYDAVGDYSEYDNLLSEIDNKLDEIITKYRKYVNVMSSITDSIKNARFAYKNIENL